MASVSGGGGGGGDSIRGGGGDSIRGGGGERGERREGLPAAAAAREGGDIRLRPQVRGAVLQGHDPTVERQGADEGAGQGTS